MATTAYKQFLASPNSSLLADNATLHYITTLTSFTGATEIIKHLTALRRQVTKKKEEALNVVEGQDAIVAEVDTALEFLTSGGTYLPGLDDNFLSDRIAYISITHFVSFDHAGKISQIRLHWDQGSLLKQLEIIGKTGRNWPIKDSREQLALIQSALKSSGKITQEASHNDLVVRNRQNSKNALRDPHASLQLFGNREELEAADAASVLNPYAGNKPRQRDFTEILGDNPQEESDALFHRPVSPSKSHHHPEMRIYDGSRDVEAEEEPKPKKDPLIRPHPTKYNHFEFADGSDPQDAPKRGVDFDKKPKTKHDSQWSFDDFTTPHKSHPSRGARSQDVRHWDPENLNEGPADAGPGRARRDAETHFELQDDGERDPDAVERPSRPRGAGHNEGLGLYKNQLFDEEDPALVNKRTSALGNITNLKDRGKDFDAHFTMTDKSPAPERTQQVPEGKKKAVKMMDHNWEVYEQSPLKENAPQRNKVEGGTHLHIAGDGMGGKKGSTRNWLYGDDEEENTKPVPPRKGNQNVAQKNFWDF